MSKALRHSSLDRAGFAQRSLSLNATGRPFLVGRDQTQAQARRAHPARRQASDRTGRGGSRPTRRSSSAGTSTSARHSARQRWAACDRANGLLALSRRRARLRMSSMQLVNNGLSLWLSPLRRLGRPLAPDRRARRVPNMTHAAEAATSGVNGMACSDGGEGQRRNSRAIRFAACVKLRGASKWQPPPTTSCHTAATGHCSGKASCNRYAAITTTAQSTAKRLGGLSLAKRGYPPQGPEAKGVPPSR